MLAFLLAWALVVMSADIARLLWPEDGDDPPAASPAASASAASTSTLPADAPATGSFVAPPVAPASTAPPGSGRAGANVSAPSATTPVTPPPALPPPPAVLCHSDLALEDSPDAPFNFLCTQDGAPVTWPTNRITLFADGLSAQQETALQLALVEFQQASGFTVLRIEQDAADVVMTVGSLSNGEGGHATVHYVCTTTCAFDRAAVVLSTERLITQGLWVTTMLHELGHVAGLNHVSRASQVMFPEITLQTPLVYGSGDRAGFDALAVLRST